MIQKCFTCKIWPLYDIRVLSNVWFCPENFKCPLGRAKFWNIVIFSHIFVSWGSTKRKSVVTSPIVQSWAPGTNLNIMLFCPVIGCLGCSALWLVQMVQQEIFPGAQLCTMGDVTTLFLFDEPQLTIIWLNVTMFQNFAHPILQCPSVQKAELWALRACSITSSYISWSHLQSFYYHSRDKH